MKNLNIRNSNLVYEEDLPNGNKPGKLTFSQFNLNAQNLNSNKSFKNTVVPIKIHTQFMNVAPMKVNWVLVNLGCKCNPLKSIEFF